MTFRYLIEDGEAAPAADSGSASVGTSASDIAPVDTILGTVKRKCPTCGKAMTKTKDKYVCKNCNKEV